MTRRAVARCVETGCALTAFAIALTLVVIWDQNRTKGRAWHR